jgi:uncharacterized protein YifN (PemK superfamily)
MDSRDNQCPVFTSIAMQDVVHKIEISTESHPKVDSQWKQVVRWITCCIAAAVGDDRLRLGGCVCLNTYQNRGLPARRRPVDSPKGRSEVATEVLSCAHRRPMQAHPA